MAPTTARPLVLIITFAHNEPMSQAIQPAMAQTHADFELASNSMRV
jgi:hypothetical protein